MVRPATVRAKLITFRYHVVSLVAVFLALGLGVLFGVSFIDQNVVAALKQSQDRLETRNGSLKGNVLDLEKLNRNLNDFADKSAAHLIPGALDQHAVVVLAFDSTPQDVVAKVIESLQSAGAAIDGLIVLSSKLDGTTPERHQQAAIALGGQISSGVDVSGPLVESITQALTGRASGFMQRLIDAGLATQTIVKTGTDRSPSTLDPQGSGLILLAPADPKRALLDRFAVPLAKSLAASSPTVLAAEVGHDKLVFLGPVRQAGGKIVTVDSIETAAGRAALVLGLAASFSGTYGHYGFGPGATATLPDFAR